MIYSFFALGIIGLIVISSELMWHLKLMRHEAGRKYIHILSAVFVSSWPFFLSFKTITILSLILLLGVLLARRLRLSKSIHTSGRLTSGDLLFPLGISLASLITTNKWLFCAAMLQIGLADGLAGLMGRHFNVGLYKVMNNTKSLLGSLTFLLTSMVIMFWLIKDAPSGIPDSLLPYTIAIVAPVLTIAEAVSPLGLDNITVPLLTIALLRVVV